MGVISLDLETGIHHTLDLSSEAEAVTTYLAL